MKKLYTLISAALLIGTAQTSTAQCAGERYHNYIFPTVPTPTVDVAYGSNITVTGTTQSLKMDIYQPVGDMATSRPLVILCHGGSFYTGAKNGPDVVPLCQDLARLGYVTASMEYRLGITNFPFPSLHVVDKRDAGASLVRAVQDARAAVRFFRKNARDGGNTYGIDTNNIFFGGVSAGGLTALHLAYLDQWSEFPPYIDTTGVTFGTSSGELGLHGGLEGVSGNPEYPSTVKAIINISGALGDTAWMQPGDIPVLSFHGTADGTVPYGHDTIAVSGFPLLPVDGSSVVAMKATSLGIENCMETWLGVGHTPEVAGTGVNYALYYDSTITIVRNFLEHFTCSVTLDCSYTHTPQLGVSEIISSDKINIYPNPAANSVHIDLSSCKGHEVNIELYDVLGQKMKNIINIKSPDYILNRENLHRGIYFMNIISEGKTFSSKIIFE